MNPSSSFTILPPPNPNPNPNPNSHFFSPHHHPYSTATATADTPSRPPDLHTTLTTLKHLIHLSKTTIRSISNLFPTVTSTTAAATCPYNSHHRLPPDSLFHHHLQCPSSPAPVDLALLDSLHYPNSLQSAHSLINQQNNQFTLTLPNDASADLCFSLDPYHTSPDSNFFYRDCPAVVTFPHDDDRADRMLILPAVLSAECANFTSDGNHDMNVTIDGVFSSSSSNLIKLLPSEYWNVKTEVDQWNDYPSFYSYHVLRSLLCLYMSQKGHWMEWVLVNSPCYGVVIDRFMGDHILLLFRLCLKAIAREAVGSLYSFSRGEPKGGEHCFECPVLVKVLMWLASQLAVLYGEVNGKLFAVNMLRQLSLIDLSKSLYLSGEQRVGKPCLSEVDGKLEPLIESKENDTSTVGMMIFVSQVAAAVAALHERSCFETRIRAIRVSGSSPIYQRVAEHVYISKKSEEERKKRSNYRPIIEHDGVLWQRGGNQETNKNKSKEELLAEERDYKRRRMSYRGKKMKRSTTQVMRDIIEEYMEEIKQASMVGRPHEDAVKLGSEPSSTPTPDVFTDNESRSKAYKGDPRGHRKDSCSDINIRSTRSGINNKQRPEELRQEYHAIDDSRYHRESFSRSADGRRSTSRSHDHEQRYEQKHSRKYYPSNHQRDQVHNNVEGRDTFQRSRYKTQKSSVVHNEFEDRYDPSKSHDINENSLYPDN